MSNREAQAILRLHIMATEPLQADIVGQLIERLDIAFSAFAKKAATRGAPTRRLRILEIRTGSLIADLIAVGEALSTVLEKRELLGGFVAQLADATNWLAGLPSRGSKPKPSDVATLQVLAAPVANDRATQVNLSLVGDNTTILVITPEIFEAMIPSIRALTGETSRRSTGWSDGAFSRTLAAAESRPVGSPIPHQHGKDWKPNTIDAEGTLILVDGKWAVSVTNSELVLPAVAVPSDLTESANSIHRVIGHIISFGSQPLCFRIDSITD